MKPLQTRGIGLPATSSRRHAVRKNLYFNYLLTFAATSLFLSRLKLFSHCFKLRIWFSGLIYEDQNENKRVCLNFPGRDESFEYLADVLMCVFPPQCSWEQRPAGISSLPPLLCCRSLIWFNVPGAAAANLISPCCQHICKTHKRLFFCLKKVPRFTWNSNKYCQLDDVK